MSRVAHVNENAKLRWSDTDRLTTGVFIEVRRATKKKGSTTARAFGRRSYYYVHNGVPLPCTLSEIRAYTHTLRTKLGGKLNAILASGNRPTAKGKTAHRVVGDAKTQRILGSLKVAALASVLKEARADLLAKDGLSKELPSFLTDAGARKKKRMALRAGDSFEVNVECAFAFAVAGLEDDPGAGAPAKATKKARIGPYADFYPFSPKGRRYYGLAFDRPEPDPSMGRRSKTRALYLELKRQIHRQHRDRPRYYTMPPRGDLKLAKAGYTLFPYLVLDATELTKKKRELEKASRKLSHTFHHVEEVKRVFAEADLTRIRSQKQRRAIKRMLDAPDNALKEVERRIRRLPAMDAYKLAAFAVYKRWYKPAKGSLCAYAKRFEGYWQLHKGALGPQFVHAHLNSLLLDSPIAATYAQHFIEASRELFRRLTGRSAPPGVNEGIVRIPRLAHTIDPTAAPSLGVSNVRALRGQLQAGLAPKDVSANQGIKSWIEDITDPRWAIVYNFALGLNETIQWCVAQGLSKMDPKPTLSELRNARQLTKPVKEVLTNDLRMWRRWLTDINDLTPAEIGDARKQMRATRAKLRPYAQLRAKLWIAEKNIRSAQAKLAPFQKGGSHAPWWKPTLNSLRRAAAADDLLAAMHDLELALLECDDMLRRSPSPRVNRIRRSLQRTLFRVQDQLHSTSVKRARAASQAGPYLSKAVASLSIVCALGYWLKVATADRSKMAWHAYLKTWLAALGSTFCALGDLGSAMGATGDALSARFLKLFTRKRCASASVSATSGAAGQYAVGDNIRKGELGLEATRSSGGRTVGFSLRFAQIGAIVNTVVAFYELGDLGVSYLHGTFHRGKAEAAPSTGELIGHVLVFAGNASVAVGTFLPGVGSVLVAAGVLAILIGETLKYALAQKKTEMSTYLFQVYQSSHYGHSSLTGKDGKTLPAFPGVRANLKALTDACESAELAFSIAPTTFYALPKARIIWDTKKRSAPIVGEWIDFSLETYKIDSGYVFAHNAPQWFKKAGTRGFTPKRFITLDTAKAKDVRIGHGRSSVTIKTAQGTFQTDQQITVAPSVSWRLHRYPLLVTQSTSINPDASTSAIKPIPGVWSDTNIDCNFIGPKVHYPWEVFRPNTWVWDNDSRSLTSSFQGKNYRDYSLNIELKDIQRLFKIKEPVWSVELSVSAAYSYSWTGRWSTSTVKKTWPGSAASADETYALAFSSLFEELKYSTGGKPLSSSFRDESQQAGTLTLTIEVTYTGTWERYIKRSHTQTSTEVLTTTK